MAPDSALFEPKAAAAEGLEDPDQAAEEMIRDRDTSAHLQGIILPIS